MARLVRAGQDDYLSDGGELVSLDQAGTHLDSRAYPAYLPRPTRPAAYGVGASASAVRVAANGLAWRDGSAARVVADAQVYAVGQRWASGGMTTTQGAAFDLALGCAYSRLLGEAEFGQLHQWMLAEYGLAGSGSGPRDIFRPTRLRR